MSANSTFEGACTCGAIRYRMTSSPLFVHCCHCSWCQRESGAAFALNAMIESDRLELLQGEPELVDTPSNSGKGQLIARCPRCRVALWSHYAGAGKAVSFVRVGTLNEPYRLPPDIHIFTSTKQPWVVLPSNIPAVEEYYDRETCWPAASLARRKALSA
ncbi:MAG TPA: GFA family protein [Rhodanobacter sp.]|nr:GFA family protein [Rhodanobacter sp.]